MHASSHEDKPLLGRCWLVGSGPGDSELLTVKAVRLLREAEVVIYDELGTEDALNEFVDPEAERVYVGKRGNRLSIKQAAINEMLVSHCLQGKKVVRLKGGCLSTFSRAGHELRALAAAGVSVEMVPGVSSALAAPVLAGFPLTDTTLSQSYAVVSAHDPAAIKWEGFSGVDTLVILMAARNLPEIVDELLAAKRDGATPVAVVRAASTPEQQSWFSTLADLLADVGDPAALSPCIVIVGNIAGLPKDLGLARMPP